MKHSCKHIRSRFYGLSLLLALPGFCQENSSNGNAGTRQMYYLATRPKESLPPVTGGTANPQPVSAKAPPALHLGLRYNLALVDPTNNRSQTIPANRTLHVQDCFAVELQSNRSGYLYVLAKQSSGAWIPLLPSSQMSDEENVLDPGKKVRLPRNHCFEIENPPGAEQLFVVLSRDPRDFLELYEATKRKAEAASKDTKVNSAVQHLAEKFGTRDLAIRKSEAAGNGNESENAVYVVSSSDTPTSTIVAQIKSSASVNRGG